MALPKIALVAGPPHGAATITSIVLGQHPDIFPVGEMHNFPHHRHFKEDRVCTCGRKSTECPFWLSVRDQYAVHENLAEDDRLPRLYEIDTPLKIETPRGGVHLWFRSSGERCRNLRGDEIEADVKGIGGFVVARVRHRERAARS